MSVLLSKREAQDRFEAAHAANILASSGEMQSRCHVRHVRT